MRQGGRSPFTVNWLVHRVHRRYVEHAVGLYARGCILDVGSGDGPFSSILTAHSETLTKLELDRRRFATIPSDVWGDGMALPFQDSSFETVVSFQVLEHVPRPSKMIAEIGRVLSPGGVMILTAPHMWGIHEEPHDFFRFTSHGLRQLAGEAGLTVVSVEPLAGYWVTTAARACYYLQHFEKIGLALLTRPLYAVIQVVGAVLDKLHRVDSDAWNFMLIAEQPNR